MNQIASDFESVTLASMDATKNIGESLKQAFGQPAGQNIPDDLLGLLVELDRSHHQPRVSAAAASTLQRPQREA